MRICPKCGNTDLLTEPETPAETYGSGLTVYRCPECNNVGTFFPEVDNPKEFKKELATKPLPQQDLPTPRTKVWLIYEGIASLMFAVILIATDLLAGGLTLLVLSGIAFSGIYLAKTARGRKLFLCFIAILLVLTPLIAFIVDTFW